LTVSKIELRTGKHLCVQRNQFGEELCYSSIDTKFHSEKGVGIGGCFFVAFFPLLPFYSDPYGDIRVSGNG